jgi:hypothetical protein
VNEEVIARMRGRVEQVRKVMALAHDRRMIDMLQKIIDEGEADIAKLEGEGPSNEMPPPSVGV